MTARPPEQLIAEITDWFLKEGRFLPDIDALAVAYCERLIAAGIPLRRLTTGVPSLHPQVDSFSTLWEAGKGVSLRMYRSTDADEVDLRGSPIFQVYTHGRTVRMDLAAPSRTEEPSILADLRAQGLTDYVVVPAPFSDGSFKAVSYATDRAGGFSADEVAVLEGATSAMAAIMETRYLRLVARTLVETYIGPQAGARVLAGQIKRGMGETIRAVVWVCDLRGFTEISQRLPGPEVIDLLNDYFGAMGGAIEDQKGEILKFIGDAMLAIFPYGRRGGPAVAASRALDAARGASLRMRRINGARAERGKDPIRFGIALHVGDVIYGNIGAEDRLDFTVIGPAVNLASRIEGLCRDLGRTVLVSEDFVRAHGGSFAPAGRHVLKGMDGDHAVFAPDLD